MEVEVLNYGGIITSIKVPDSRGKIDDVVLGFKNPEDYQKEHPYFGCLVGRYANRIAKGIFELEGKTYKLAINNGPNSLHGGLKGFDKHFWDVTPGDSKLTLRRISPDGEEGYPGNLELIVTYSLSPENELLIEYKAMTDKTTHLNLTNHSYFNLNPMAGNILEHELMINAQKFTVVDPALTPTGELRDVRNGPMDFLQAHKIGQNLSEVPGGYDHNYVLMAQATHLKHAATLTERTSGRVMEVHTTQPGIQFYSGNFLDGTLEGKNGNRYQKHDGFCLETQHFPDSPNWPHFPSTKLAPSEIFESTTLYRFYTL